MSEPSQPRSKITVEDLLRLKRAERPSEEFWSEFDRQLRVKQLSAIVNRQPWWRTFPRSFAATVSRYHVPMGAAAVVALTLITVRQYHKTDATASVKEAEAGTVKMESVAVLSASPSADAKTLAPVENAPVVAAVGESSGELKQVSVSAQSDGVSEHAEVMASLPIDAIRVAVANSMEETLPLATEEPVQLAATTKPSEQDPLAQVAGPREVRRSRLLAYNVAMDPRQNEGVVHSRERITSRLNEQALYDSISRLGVNGDSLSIKF